MAKRVSRLKADEASRPTRPQGRRGLKADEAERKLREHREHVADRQLFVTVACFTGAELATLSRFDWTNVYFAIDQVHVPGTKNTARERAIKEKRPFSASYQGEGRRTRTFNQRIKSPMLYH